MRIFMLQYGVCIFFIVMQIVLTTVILATDLKSNMNPDFDHKVYSKPYCRITPYMIGVMLAFKHYERSERTRSMECLDLGGTSLVPSWKQWNLPKP